MLHSQGCHCKQRERRAQKRIQLSVPASRIEVIMPAVLLGLATAHNSAARRSPNSSRTQAKRPTSSTQTGIHARNAHHMSWLVRRGIGQSTVKFLVLVLWPRVSTGGLALPVSCEVAISVSSLIFTLAIATVIAAVLRRSSGCRMLHPS